MTTIPLTAAAGRGIHTTTIKEKVFRKEADSIYCKNAILILK